MTTAKPSIAPAEEALTNVQRHAKANHARVELALFGDEQAANGMGNMEIQISIGHDGIGVDETASTRGHGLRGLAERATHLGGALRIQPQTGGGTQIECVRPYPYRRHSKPALPTTESIMADPITILLVHYQRLMRDGLRTLLELEEDFTVVGEAANGEEALAGYAHWQPTIVLMDVRMPGDGWC